MPTNNNIVPADGSLPEDDQQCDRLRRLLDDIKKQRYFLRPVTGTRTLFYGTGRVVTPASHANRQDIAELVATGYVDDTPDYAHRETRTVEGEDKRSTLLLVRLTAEGGELLFRLKSRARTGTKQPKRLWSKPTGEQR